jgi:hypothetical protein
LAFLSAAVAALGGAPDSSSQRGDSGSHSMPAGNEHSQAPVRNAP